MKSWERSVLARPCGGCSTVIPLGAPTLVLRSPDRAHPWTKYRCEACAEEPVPDVLPRPDQPGADPAASKGRWSEPLGSGRPFAARLSEIASRVLADYKLAQAGDE